MFGAANTQTPEWLRVIVQFYSNKHGTLNAPGLVSLTFAGRLQKAIESALKSASKN